MRLALLDSILNTGWTFDFSPDEERLREVGDEMTSRIFAVSMTIIILICGHCTVSWTIGSWRVVRISDCC